MIKFLIFQKNSISLQSFPMDTYNAVSTTLLKCFAGRPRIFRSGPEKQKNCLSVIYFSSNFFYGSVECSFDNAAQESLPNTETYRSTSKNDRKKICESCFSLNCLNGHVENSFDNSAKSISPQGWRVSAQGPKMIQKRGFFFQKIPLKCSYGCVEWRFGTTAHKFLLEDKNFFAQSSKMFQKVDIKKFSRRIIPDT